MELKRAVFLQLGFSRNKNCNESRSIESMVYKMKKKDVSIVGDLCNLDLFFAEHLSRVGLLCQVLRPSKYYDADKTTLTTVSNYFKKYDPEKGVVYYKRSLDFYKLCCESRLVISFTLGIISALRYSYFLRFLKFPPIINVATGSDVTELICKKTILGYVYRFHLRNSRINWCVPYPHALKNIIRFKIPRTVFMAYPFYALGKKDAVDESVRNNKKKDTGIRFFHPSHLDWKVNDPGAERNSSKGNDRFIRAFIRAVKDGLPGYCVILDRGPDKEEAKRLINDYGAQEYFVWKPPLSGDEMFREYEEADVVVDQFDVGGLGAIAIEAMSVGRPVMVYLQEKCMNLLYGEFPPVLKCYTEDEIYQQIMRCEDRKILVEMGHKAKEWVYKHHSWENCLDQFLFYYTLLTGHKIIDYGWDRNPYTES
jgi:glycosyltransferase involved in cell wall biosynthesis